MPTEATWMCLCVSHKPDLCRRLADQGHGGFSEVNIKEVMHRNCERATEFLCSICYSFNPVLQKQPDQMCRVVLWLHMQKQMAGDQRLQVLVMPIGCDVLFIAMKKSQS